MDTHPLDGAKLLALDRRELCPIARGTDLGLDMAAGLPLDRSSMALPNWFDTSLMVARVIFITYVLPSWAQTADSGARSVETNRNRAGCTRTARRDGTRRSQIHRV